MGLLAPPARDVPSPSYPLSNKGGCSFSLFQAVGRGDYRTCSDSDSRATLRNASLSPHPGVAHQQGA